MLKRQRCLLYMIERAGRPVTHFELTKWSFLLAHEMPSGGGAAFYQFLPYQRGPFSFCLYREAGVLVRNGYLLDHGKSWRLVEDVPRPTDDLPTLVRADAARVVERFGGQAQDELMDYVYGHFPWFTVNSNARKLDSRPVGTAAICTAGYEGWQVDGFLNMLMCAGIHAFSMCATTRSPGGMASTSQLSVGCAARSESNTCTSQSSAYLPICDGS